MALAQEISASMIEVVACTLVHLMNCHSYIIIILLWRNTYIVGHADLNYINFHQVHEQQSLLTCCT